MSEASAYLPNPPRPYSGIYGAYGAYVDEAAGRDHHTFEPLPESFPPDPRTASFWRARCRVRSGMPASSAATTTSAARCSAPSASTSCRDASASTRSVAWLSRPERLVQRDPGFAFGYEQVDEALR